MTKTTQAKTKPKSTPKAKPATKSTQPPRKRGRPTSYTQVIADLICDKIATTDMGLRRICEADDRLPAVETIRMWCWKNQDFQAQYTRAKEQQQLWMVERAQEISDDGRNDTYVDDDGRVKVDTDVIQRSRLRVDTIKWAASKLATKRFGEKVDVNHGGQVENPLEVLFKQVAGTPYKPGGSE